METRTSATAVSGSPRRTALAAVAAVLSLASCARDKEGASVLVTVVAPAQGSRPEHLLVTWWVGAAVVVDRRRVPESGSFRMIGGGNGPVATISFQLGSDLQERRLLVIGLRGDAPIAMGAARVPHSGNRRSEVTVTLQSRLADSDGDGIPDEIDDDCARHDCGADGGVEARGDGPGALDVISPPDAAGPGDATAPPRLDAFAPERAVTSSDARFDTLVRDGPVAAADASPDGRDAGTTGTADAPADAIIELSRGLVGAWALDEIMGPTATDRSGNGNHGVLKNPVVMPWVKGHRGTALTFAPQMSVAIPPSGSLDSISTQVSIAAWIWRDANPPAADYHTILARQKGTTSVNVWWLGFHGSNLRMALDGTAVESESPVPTGRWVHVAGVFDGQQMRCYQDGVMVDHADPGARSFAAGGRPSTMGGDANSASLDATANFFVGRIDDVALYNRALSASEVTALAAVAPEN